MTLAALLLLSVIPALTPVPQNANPDSGWMKRHAKVLEQAKAGGSEVVFLGDSITQGWEGRGVQVWRKYFLDPPYRALNLGFSGDRTENVLWRIDHGELDGYKAKAIVLMIGTNNGGCAESVEGTKRSLGRRGGEASPHSRSEPLPSGRGHAGKNKRGIRDKETIDCSRS